MLAGFSEKDITPEPGILKIGMLKRITTKSVSDPLYARAALFKNNADYVGIIQLDTLSIRATETRRIRDRIVAATGIKGDRIMVCATHNHAGPAVANAGLCERDDVYLDFLVERACAAFQEAANNLQEAELGFTHVYNFTLAHNRRVVMRDGTVRTQHRFTDPNALYVEGPIDPEVAVIAARRPAAGAMLGCILNYACHPVHSGGDTTLSAGFPGAFAAAMKAADCPVALFLNGASGNIHTLDVTTGTNCTKEEAGHALAAAAQRALEQMTFESDWPLAARCSQLDLPYREVTDAEIRGETPQTQRFIDSTIYDAAMPSLLQRLRERQTQPAEVQTFRIGPVGLTGIPGEYFVEHGLRIKTSVTPLHALVAGCTNGMVGYVPTREAFTRGGYETTFAPTSRLAPEAGDILADTAIAMLNSLSC